MALRTWNDYASEQHTKQNEMRWVRERQQTFKRMMRAEGYTKAGAVCLCKVAGHRRCQQSTYGGDCYRQYQTLFDHHTCWRRAGGEFVMIGEPYQVGGELLREFLADAETLGLDISISGRSIWNPGACVRITVTKAEEARQTGEREHYERKFDKALHRERTSAASH
jgi:hypothetical protein